MPEYKWNKAHVHVLLAPSKFPEKYFHRFFYVRLKLLNIDFLGISIYISTFSHFSQNCQNGYSILRPNSSFGSSQVALSDGIINFMVDFFRKIRI
jgi:hypothetical protein